MKYFVILLIFVGSAMLAPNAFGSESFYGTSSFENTPSELTLGKPTQFEIKFQYTAGPYALSNFSPVIDVSPTSASSMVHIDVEPLEGISQGQIIRIPVTITVNPNIEHEKIFLSIYFTGDHFSSRSDVFYKSAWSDSITFDIAPKDQGGVFVDYEIIPWGDFQYEFVGDAAIFKNNLTRISILEAGTQYYIVQKAEFRASTFGDKDTRVNATIGYAIQSGDQILRPPMNEDATDAEHEEFNKKVQKQIKEFPQQSPISDSYDFVVDIENPFYIKFSFSIEEPGQYTRQFYKNTHIFEGPGSSGMGVIAVVDKFSKAVDENSQCKNDNFRRLIKYDYSTIVCVESETAWKLKGRGWGM